MLRLALPLAAFLLSPLAFAGFAGSVIRTAEADVGGHAMVADVIEPRAGPALGVAIVAHGWTRSRERHRDLGRALAEAGVVAIVPDLPNVMDLWGNGDAIADLAQALEGGALGLPPIDRSRLVLVGTSAGGLATLLAGSKLPGVAGWVGLDPVDRTGTGSAAASKLAPPAIVLLGDDSACNLFGSGRSLARAVPRLLRAERIRGTSHCDFESPTNKTCEFLCGDSKAGRRAEVRDASVAAVLELLAAGGPPDLVPPGASGDAPERDVPR